MEAIKLGIIGIGGFGKIHLDNIRILENAGRVKLEAACDNNLERYGANLKELSFDNIRKYESIDKFLSEETQLDLVVITTPIPFHKEMCCKALRAGNNVLIEKPPAVTIQDMDEMIRVRKETGKLCFVDFQETSKKSFLELKGQLSKGRIGRITRVSAAGAWNRTQAYFNRSPWVGKISFNGKYVLDGTINNPFSHLLNNSLILAGLQEGSDNSAEWVKAEIYRANNIEGEDTSCLRVGTKGGVEVMFFATLCNFENREPYIMVHGTEGTALYMYEGLIEYRNLQGNMTGSFKVEGNSHLEHYENIVSYMEGTAGEKPCSLEDARNFVLMANLAFESSGKTHRVGGKHVELRSSKGLPVEMLSDEEDYVYIKNIADYIDRGITENKLFSELGAEWAAETRPSYGQGYDMFDLFKLYK